jgi:Family of unknown function (DUF6461)
MRSADAADYTWADDWVESVAQAYCLTLARGLEPGAFLRRMGAVPEATCEGLAELSERAFRLWDAAPVEHLLIGAATVPGRDGAGWALGLEINGFLGVTPEAVTPLSAGTRVVSHYSNAGMNRFYWLDDTDIRLHFEPLFPADRRGSTPDALVDAMREVGFDLREDGDNTERAVAATFALAEHLTGVPLTRDLLDHSVYQCGIAAFPGLSRD